MIEVIPDMVSTVIPSYNRAHLLRTAVGSVMEQDHCPLEVIVVDDGSTDATAAELDALSQEWPVSFRSVRIDNAGPGPAREAGRLLARGEFIQYLDSDDRLLQGKFRRQVAALRDHPDCGIAYGMTRLVDTDGQELQAPYKWTGKALPTLFPMLLVDRWWCTHTPLYRRQVTDAIGPWSDLRFSQDWEYDARAGAMGVPLAYCPEYVSEHTHHDGVRQTSGGKWLTPAQRVRFFGLLLEHARRAGVGADAPEMRHFARWVFLNCRQVAETGNTDEAIQLLALAADAGGRQSLDMKVFQATARLLGWQRAARAAERARTWLSRSPGRNTLAQSWVR